MALLLLLYATSKRPFAASPMSISSCCSRFLSLCQPNKPGQGRSWFFTYIYVFIGAVNTLSVREERYFKPSPSAFIKVAGRGPDAWQIRPGSYFLLPFKEAFGRQISRDFTIFLTIRPAEESEVSLLSSYDRQYINTVGKNKQKQAY